MAIVTRSYASDQLAQITRVPQPMPSVPGATLAEIERYAILETLQSVDGSVAQAARILGISTRKIHYRLRDWGV